MIYPNAQIPTLDSTLPYHRLSELLASLQGSHGRTSEVQKDLNKYFPNLFDDLGLDWDLSSCKELAEDYRYLATGRIVTLIILYPNQISPDYWLPLLLGDPVFKWLNGYPVIKSYHKYGSVKRYKKWNKAEPHHGFVELFMPDQNAEFFSFL